MQIIERRRIVANNSFSAQKMITKQSKIIIMGYSSLFKDEIEQLIRFAIHFYIQKRLDIRDQYALTAWHTSFKFIILEILGFHCIRLLSSCSYWFNSFPPSSVLTQRKVLINPKTISQGKVLHIISNLIQILKDDKYSGAL